MARKWWCAKYEREVVMLRLGGGFVWERRCRLPVSRILSILLARDWTAISLTPPRRSALLAQGATNTRGWNGRATLPLFCLAPRGVCIATRVTPRCGGLLPHHFTLTLFGSGSCGGRFVFCCTFRPGSSRFPSPVFTGRAALWCPDFPQPRLRGTATVREAAGVRWGGWWGIPRKRLGVGGKRGGIGGLGIGD